MPPPLTTSRWIARCCLLLCGVTALYALAVVWAGSAATWRALQTIGAPAMAGGTLLCTLTLLPRYLRWRGLLAALGHRPAEGFNLRVYLAGLALSSTPGKLGETLRSALLLQRGVPVPHSLAAFFADRSSDVIGVALIGAAAGALAGARLPLLEALALGGLAATLLAAWWLRRRTVDPGTPAPVGGPWHRRWARQLIAPARAWAAVWTGMQPLTCVLAAVVAYGVQAAVLAWYTQLLQPGIGVADVGAMFASSVLIGAASGLPGGLGAMDGALALQLQGQGATWAQAVAITLAARVSTLWLAWAIGFAALASFAGRDAPTLDASLPSLP